LGLTLAASGFSALAEGQPVKVRIDSGVVIGRASATLESFRGVPFAAPPVGDLRWRPPQPAAAWSADRDASRFGPACLQPQRPDGRPNAGGYSGGTSEDCLNLNIYAARSAKHAPVMVWIYGGANVYGANALPSYDGAAFARDGVVLVEINYRLGALGFFAHPALTKAAGPGEALANYGLMDQVAGLQWVKRNIAAFGGDPRNVTVFGESAGGVDILALMGAPSAKGLFEKAIVESGGGWFPADSMTAAEAKGAALAQKAGAPATASAADLRAIPAETLVVHTEGSLGPAVDGKFLTQQPEAAWAKGEVVHVPLIIGSNSFEASLMQSFRIPPEAYLSIFPPAVKTAYAKEADDDAGVANALFTDFAMGAPARWVAGKASSGAPAWLYYFSYVRVAQRSRLPGANHASEIPYVFDSQDVIPGYSTEIVDQDRALAKVMHACWVAFAKAAAPSCAGAPVWPAYHPAKDELMEFGQAVAVREHFRKPQFDLLDTVEQARAARDSGK
jgi:para-nitrobenzyl esterase